MASKAEENYLKALFSLAIQKEKVNASELGNLLKVSLPTVNSMMKNLKKQGLISYEKYKPISLSATGKIEAAQVIRKHRLTEMYLFERMGFGWDEVHEIAEQMEHIDSAVFFNRMDEILGNPTIDPHGSPIPDKNGKISMKQYSQLSKCESGKFVVLKALSDDSSDLLRFLDIHELNLGVVIEIKSVESYDGSMTITYFNHPSETMSRQVCDQLLIEEILS